MATARVPRDHARQGAQRRAHPSCGGKGLQDHVHHVMALSRGWIAGSFNPFWSSRDNVIGEDGALVARRRILVHVEHVVELSG